MPPGVDIHIILDIQNAKTHDVKQHTRSDRRNRESFFNNYHCVRRIFLSVLTSEVNSLNFYRERIMKQKLGTVIESDILRRAKRQAAEEDRPLSDLIQDALERYLMTGTPTPGRREAAYRVFCDQPMRITTQQFREVLQADVWDK